MTVETALLDLSMRVRLAGVRLDKPQRDAMNAALVNVLHEARVGSGTAPILPQEKAADLFREVTHLAVAAGVPRNRLVLIFNGDEDAAEPARRDFE